MRSTHAYIFSENVLMVSWVCTLCLLSGCMSTPTNTFGWLAGTWQNVQNGHRETWRPEQDYLQGVGYELADGDTTILETLKIIRREGDYLYIADVAHNEGEVTFRISEWSASHFVAENSTHDFPKKIIYSLVNPDQLEATISGNGRSVDFTFNRVQ